jgi:1,2-phenylacetyl-CoA epoxidase catalytic subunit
LTAAVEIASPEREALGRLIASLADNKAALGRRYGEWAVSAPTLESAVAAAAMAQDELGHARATYPLLKQLGLDHGEEACLPVLASELPSWTWFVAVNLVVDGMLTALVRACQDSAFTGLAQRARKILQEEESHAIHARAWARRLARDDLQREAFAAAVEECWRQSTELASARDLPALVAGGFIAAGAEQLRTSLGGTIVDALPDPACPNCGSGEDVTLVSGFGGQIITAQWHCDGCRTHFEAVRL